MTNRKREIDSLADFEQQIAEYFNPWDTMSAPWEPTDYCKEHFVMYDPETERMRFEMARLGWQELRAALSSVTVGNTKPALEDLAKKFDMPITDS